MKYLSLSSGHFQCRVIDAELWYCAGCLLIMDSFLNVWVFSRISQLQTSSHEFPDALECLIKWRINFNEELMRRGGSSVCLGWRFLGSLLNLQVKFGAHLNLQKFHHVRVSIKSFLTFILPSHSLLLLIVYSSHWSFCNHHFAMSFFSPFFFFSLFAPPVSVDLYIWPLLRISRKQADVLCNLKGSGQYLVCYIFPHLPRAGGTAALATEVCGSSVSDPSSHQPEEVTESSWVHLSLPPLWTLMVCCLQVWGIKLLFRVFYESNTEMLWWNNTGSSWDLVTTQIQTDQVRG